MDEILAKSIIEKVEGQENKISEMEAAIKNLSGITVEIENIKHAAESMKEIAETISFPTQEMRILSRSITECRKQLSHPVQNTVQHHHHFPKILWLSIGLFLALATVCAGWYMTVAALEEYKESDIKYRYLKVFGNNSIKKILFFTDSLHRANPAIRDSVIQKEADDHRVFELLQEAKRKEEEAKELKRKAGRSN
mgnify:CR=1 FL=1